MRIAIVNDLPLAVEAIQRVVLAAREHQVAWIARDGEEAVRLCAVDRPDLILMDLIMPRIDGVEATRQIMRETPCAIVVVTADVASRSARVFEAMGAGALDAVNTPLLEPAPGALDGHALQAKIETIRRLIGAGSAKQQVQPSPPGARPSSREDQPLVAIGASAGGPAAIAKILTHLHADFPAPIIVVQHVDGQFVQGLADWLDYQSPLHVRLAEEGDRPEPGTVLLAGREQHLVFVTASRLSYSRQPSESIYRPSIDLFFQSANRFWPGKITGVMLTGMGRDGAQGLQTLRAGGHHTITQDQSSCAVFGMPKAALELNAAREVLPLERIATRLTSLAAAKIKSHA